ncbi:MULTISPECIES: DsbA family protein [unclassified Rothia (in: high G+C Gram-positive bacteria)]|uniref:DsbA family protein n=1 Tax=unclassified Rothia (in: high G+C Gram-positive bacteria) TaxID=2689056 RepID=UPI00195CE50B|nr:MULTISPECIES: DsbA family protein [unclassified Rothia (in: high G+C Gram-positive bacteria)]MBM7051543.1 DsbA family protein [Rothia sp. ZJ1223]QRZ61321.1 DsbA family protein [Rothia sp. ZJ932]
MASQDTAAKDARAAARAVAAKQAQRNNKAKNNRRWLQLAVLAVVAAIVTMIAIVVVNARNSQIADSSSIPESSNDYGGIVLTADGIQKGAATMETRSVHDIKNSDTGLPMGVATAKEASANGEPVHVTVFQDYNCVHCASFEKENNELLKNLIKDGKVTVEYRNVAFLDRSSPTSYSARTANAAYAVANQVNVDQFMDYQAEIFSHQGQGGLNDNIIEEIASKHGADISEALGNNEWRPLVNVVTTETAGNGVQGTPTVYADGQTFNTSPEDFEAWINAIIESKQA